MSPYDENSTLDNASINTNDNNESLIKKEPQDSIYDQYYCSVCYIVDSDYEKFQRHLLELHPDLEFKPTCTCGIKFDFLEDLFDHQGMCVHHLENVKQQTHVIIKSEVKYEPSANTEECDDFESAKDGSDTTSTIEDNGYCNNVINETPSTDPLLTLSEDNVRNDEFVESSIINTGSLHQVAILKINKLIDCNECGKKFRCKNNLIKHLSIAHRNREVTFEKPKNNTSVFDNGDNKYECDICGKFLTTKYGLNVHIKVVHQRIKPFVCDICCKAFVQIFYLNAHMNQKHLFIKPFECQECHKCYSTKYLLKSHENVHCDTFKKHKFSCNICGKFFTGQGNRDYHVQLVHENVKPYQCNNCSKWFGRKHHLAEHIKAVHNKLRSFGCKICDKSYSRKHHLYRHVKISHLHNKISE